LIDNSPRLLDLVAASEQARIANHRIQKQALVRVRQFFSASVKLEIELAQSHLHIGVGDFRLRRQVPGDRCLGGATLADMKPMQISFTSACQFVLAGWQEICRIADSAELEVYRRKMLLSISQCVVGDRPGRFEPRVVKRRRDQYKKMSQPRATLKKRLENNDNSFE